MPKWLTGILGGLGSIGSFLLNQFTGLSRSEREQNQFNADQAQINRDFQATQQSNQNAFNAQQAQIARDFTAQREDTSYQRTVADMQAAGINPALVVSNGAIGASGMQPASAGSAPSGSAAQGSGGGRASLSEILQAANFAKQLKLVDAQIANVKSDTAVNTAHASQIESQTSGQELSNQEAALRLEYFQPLNDAQLAVLNSSLENDRVQRALHESGISLNDAQRLLTLNNALASSIDNQTRHQLNQLEVRLRIAQISNTYQSTAESRARVKTLEAEAVELYQRCLVHAANANQLDESARYIAEQTGLLKYDEKSKQFEVNHQKAAWNWSRIQLISGVVRDIGIGVGSVTSAFARFGNPATAAPSPSSLFLPRSQSFNGVNYGVAR